MNRILKFFIRSSAFIGKELTAILRQPKLIVSLVLGPFLIILLFGLGFPDQSRDLRTTFVIETEGPITANIEAFAKRLSSPMIFQGVESDKNIALAQLALNQTDLVIVVPENADQTIQNNEQAKFLVFHNEVDPFQVGYIQFIGSTFADLINRQTLLNVTVQGQEEAASVQTNLETAIANAKAIREALEANDLDTAVSQKEEFQSNFDLVRLAVGGTLAVISGVENTFGGGETTSAENEQLIQQTLEEATQSATVFDELTSDAQGLDYAQKASEVQTVEEKLTELNERLTEFRALSPTVLISPFISETTSISGLQFTPIGFFAPAVIVLLLQHLSITFAALSIVRERTSGIMELFRVSPISAFETLSGKLLSYLVFELLIAAAITALVVWGLGVPMLGNWLHFALAVFVLLFTSVCLGFLISLISDTDTQAVQYSMLLLLASIFFTGFFLDLRLMWRPISFLPWMLPATYGIYMLQDIMLRGYPIPFRILLGIAGMGLIFFITTWLLLRRKMEIH